MGMSSSEAYSDPTILFKTINAGQVGFFVGSFISVWFPANAPDARALRNGALRATWESLPSSDGVEDEVITTLETSSIRLELVFEEMFYRIGRKITSLLSSLATGSPNFYHEWIAELFTTSRVPVIYTTNFDTYLDTAITGHGWKQGTDYDSWVPGDPMPSGCRPAVYYLHGRIDRPESVCVTLQQVGRQRQADWKGQLGSDLGRLPFCFMGYSGLDIDIRPVLVESPSKQLLWVDLPDRHGAPEHICHLLESRGQPIVRILADLRVLPVRMGGTELSSYVSPNLADQLYYTMVNVPASTKLVFLDRLWWNLRSSMPSRKWKLLESRMVSAALHQATGPNELWPIEYQQGNVNLQEAHVWIKNLRALYWFSRGCRHATFAGDLFGRVLCLRGLGMSTDMLALGLLAWPYHLSITRYYIRALRLSRRIQDMNQRRLAIDLCELLIARALFRTGRLQRAHIRFARLCGETDSHVRGHAFRFLALLESFREGDRDFVISLLGAAKSEFDYNQNKSDQTDVTRVEAICYALMGDFVQARKLAIKAFKEYGPLSRGQLRSVLLWIVCCVAGSVPAIGGWPFVRRFLLLK